MSTDPGDLVLDPTCGGGTTALLCGKVGPSMDYGRYVSYCAYARPKVGFKKQDYRVNRFQPICHRLAVTLRRGFVFERSIRVTLSSITRNPDIEAGKSANEVEAAIRRHAETVLFVDRPCVDGS